MSAARRGSDPGRRRRRGRPPRRGTARAPCSGACRGCRRSAVRPSSSALARPKSVIQTTPVGVQQQVRRLDVAVDDAAGMGVGQTLRRLAADLGHAAEERLATPRRRPDFRGHGPPARQDRRARRHRRPEELRGGRRSCSRRIVRPGRGRVEPTRSRGDQSMVTGRGRSAGRLPALRSPVRPPRSDSAGPQRPSIRCRQAGRRFAANRRWVALGASRHPGTVLNSEWSFPPL